MPVNNPLDPSRFLPSSEPMEPEPHSMWPFHAVFYDCEICGGLHPNGFYGDCRDDINRPTDQELNRRYGADGWITIDMEEAD